MKHIALLGDSIFDNAPYTEGGPAVIDHLRAILPSGHAADLLAVDGAIIQDVGTQLQRLTPQHTHLVLSIGGNDALQNAGVLELAVTSSTQALSYLADIVDRFESDYHRMLANCLGTGLPLVICTIYDGCFDDATTQKVVRTALRCFNDAIVRSATHHGLRVIELREVCRLPEDYANPIEPSVAGGLKIARAIVQAVLEQPRNMPGTCVTA